MSREQSCTVQAAFGSEQEQKIAQESTGVSGTWHAKESMVKADCAASLPLVSLPLDCFLTDMASAARPNWSSTAQMLL